MAQKRPQITNKGLELLSSSSKATGQHWWIGWYALAFVPDEMQEDEDEKLNPNMTKLTKNGDIIYNIFQGDMNGDGYQTSKASSQFKSVNYDSNIKKNYRYVLDEEGKNNLVTWVDGKNGLKGAYAYHGVKVIVSHEDSSIGFAASKIPLPAPLLYTGVEAAGEGWSTDGMNIFLGSGTERIENFYQVEDVGGVAVPRVSTDFRNYEGYKNGFPKPTSGDTYENGLSEFDGVDFDGWGPSANTYTQNDETDMGEDYNQYCLEYWKVLSISNFNKYCAPVNASGLLYDENTGCRNMAKVTKYFPVSDYSVTSTSKTANNEYATGIKLKIDVKLNGNAEDGAYFKEVEMSDAENVATLDPTPTPEDQALFNTQHVSFKFNRIGIYAVPMRQYGCSDDSGDMKAQYQIDTEAEPVLFAVCEWDSPVTLSDSGDGLSEFQSSVFIDLSAAVEDSSVIRESAVFYNFYEDDALDWYKNQLVANAAMGEAIINMQMELGYLRNQKSAKQGCCPKQEEIKDTGKKYTGLRNLVDAKDYESNSVRNRLALEEGKAIDDVYSDIIPEYGDIGSPVYSGDSGRTLYAKKAIVTDETEQTEAEEYSAYLRASNYTSSHRIDYSDAVLDGRTYLELVRSDIYHKDTSAVRFGGLWVSSNLYYELYSFKIPTSITNPMVYDYDGDEAQNLESYTGTVQDRFGEPDAFVHESDKWIYVKKTATGITWSDYTVQPARENQPDYPEELDDIPSFYEEIRRPLQDYETERGYTVYFRENTSTVPPTRIYDDMYLFKRDTEMTLPKIQLYKLSLDAYSRINQHLAPTGWRIPTRLDWSAIIAKSTDDKIKRIRSSEQWETDGGTGRVYPLGGAVNTRGGTMPYTPWNLEGSTEKPFIYLAIADTVEEVVVFDGESFDIISKPSTGPETGLGYVGILCVSDAVKISDGKSKYKLGYDSYALMQGSICEGEHSFNASENSIIFDSANYNSILGGMYNKVKDASHNVILNGVGNELMSAVYCAVLGDNNSISRPDPSVNSPCRILLNGTATSVVGGATSAIFAESAKVERAYQSMIMGAYDDLRNIVCSRFVGQASSNTRDIYYSDVTANQAYNLPTLHMSRVVANQDFVNGELPSPLEYASSLVTHSDINICSTAFCRKVNDTNASINMHFCKLTGISAGIINVFAAHSDITLSGFYPYNSWCNKKTLHSLNINQSTLKLSNSSITTNYVDDVESKSNITFSDISLGYSLMKMTDNGDAETSDKFEFGVMKLSYSVISLCNCSYVYETGTNHYLSSSIVKYATIVGNSMNLNAVTLKNTHIYGALSFSGSEVNNHIILGGLDGTTVGHGYSASSYISRFGSFVTSNNLGYPMILSMGGIGMFMNKMLLGNEGVTAGRAPSINDVLTVVSAEGNVATVAWKPGGGGAGGDGSHLVVVDTTFHGHYYKNGTATHETLDLTNGAGDIPFKGIGILRGNGLEDIATVFSFGQDEDKWFDGDNQNNQFRALSVDSVSTVDIYTWDAVDSIANAQSPEPHINKRYKNLHGHSVEWWDGQGENEINSWAGCPLVIDADSLVEDKAYEIRVHYMNVGANGVHSTKPKLSYTMESTPSSENPITIDMTKYSFDATGFEAANTYVCNPSDFEVKFMKSDGTSLNIAKWAIPNDNPSTISGTSFKVVIKYNLEQTEGNPGTILPEYGFGSTIFFKHGNHVYVMTY